MYMQSRSVTRDTRAIALGLDHVNAEINFYEGAKKKVKSVKKRLERLYEARKHLLENPNASESLVNQLKAIQNEST